MPQSVFAQENQCSPDVWRVAAETEMTHADMLLLRGEITRIR